MAIFGSIDAASPLSKNDRQAQAAFGGDRPNALVIDDAALMQEIRTRKAYEQRMSDCEYWIKQIPPEVKKVQDALIGKAFNAGDSKILEQIAKRYNPPPKKQEVIYVKTLPQQEIKEEKEVKKEVKNMKNIQELIASLTTEEREALINELSNEKKPEPDTDWYKTIENPNSSPSPKQPIAEVDKNPHPTNSITVKVLSCGVHKFDTRLFSLDVEDPDGKQIRFISSKKSYAPGSFINIYDSGKKNKKNYVIWYIADNGGR